MESDLFKSIYDGVTSGNWFLVAGAALSLVIIGARWALAKYWPSLKDNDVKGVAITAALAGFGALANALLAGKDVTSTLTLMGAVKVWAAAAWLYVTSKKLLASKPAPVADASGN